MSVVREDLEIVKIYLEIVKNCNIFLKYQSNHHSF